MTLVEVVAGLALLASLLVAVLLAKAAYSRQSARAGRRLQAVAAADALLSGWHRDPAALPTDGSGVVPGDGQLIWRTRVVANLEAEALGARIVRLEVMDGRATGAPVLSSVEFLVDPEARESTEVRPAAGAAGSGSPAGGTSAAKPGAGRTGKHRSTAQPHAPGVHHP